MSLATKDGFRDYLAQQQQLADNTINSYCSGLNHLSTHCGQELFALTDVQQLNALLARYIQGGADEEQGKYGNWAASNALRHWRDYVLQCAASDLPRSWLLTWNPKQFKEGGDAGVRLNEVMRWTCHSKQPKVGDNFYLIRLGEDPRGLVASGRVTRASFQDSDWRDDTKSRSYIEIKAEDVRPNCAAGLMPILLLQQLAKGSSFKWSAQSSGIEIPATLAKRVGEIWTTSKAKHSLQQYLDWSAADPEESRPEWLPTYQSRLEEAALIKKRLKALDDAALAWLWRDPVNGICSVKPAFLPKAVFENNLAFLKSLTEQVIANASVETYLHVIAQWEQAKKEQRFSQMYWGVIDRVFAAFAPDIYTTLVMPADPDKLLRGFAADFQLPNQSTGSWAEKSVEIRRCVDSIGAQLGSTAETNIALWQLFKAIARPDAEADVEVEPVQTTVESHGVTAMQSCLPLNQILYGPPGSGKTYNTINEALAILAPEFLTAHQQPDQRSKLKLRFDEFVNEGRIRFVTFHQSFSYEDFVEGLRAQTDDGALCYEVDDGVFKRLCDKARFARVDQADAFDAAISKLKDICENSVARPVLTTIRGYEFEIEFSGRKTFKAFPRSSSTPDVFSSPSIAGVRKLYMGETRNNVDFPSYAEGMLRYLKEHCSLPEYSPLSAQKDEQPAYLLIIDEINRGNISRIFGELITLIEPSKRAGADEALSVILPYSKEPFSVPNNVYIIGTMNTADRSLAGLDIALRRRFTFKEMPPKPVLVDGILVEGVDIGAMLRVMNQRIAVLLDRDHCLGHAYFMPLAAEGGNTLPKLAEIFEQNIIPLLQEYFFEDWERIRWVLNDQNKDDGAFIVEDKELNVSQLFTNLPDKLRPIPRWRVNRNAFKSIEAYRDIGGAKPTADELG